MKTFTNIFPLVSSLFPRAIQIEKRVLFKKDPTGSNCQTFLAIIKRLEGLNSICL